MRTKLTLQKNWVSDVEGAVKCSYNAEAKDKELKNNDIKEI